MSNDIKERSKRFTDHLNRARTKSFDMTQEEVKDGPFVLEEQSMKNSLMD